MQSFLLQEKTKSSNRASQRKACGLLILGRFAIRGMRFLVELNGNWNFLHLYPSTVRLSCAWYHRFRCDAPLRDWLLEINLGDRTNLLLAPEEAVSKVIPICGHRTTFRIIIQKTDSLHPNAWNRGVFSRDFRDPAATANWVKQNQWRTNPRTAER